MGKCHFQRAATIFGYAPCACRQCSGLEANAAASALGAQTLPPLRRGVGPQLDQAEDVHEAVFEGGEAGNECQ